MAKKEKEELQESTPETSTHEEQMATMSAAAEHEAAKQEAVEHKPRPKVKVLVSGAEYWKFQEPGNEVFVGTYVGEFRREKDGDISRKQFAGDVIGYNFADENGELWIISNSHSITKAVSLMSKPNAKLYIQFKGQVKNGRGEDVNQFFVGEIED